ncbi:hypothetical protein PIB30_066438 [Stylosanthes scabra]|uniref:TF-B3 domain-containing protein n=1 Tax=Stylosanthes scabra TaxID=79078 RepID=A0ABU6YJV6_9FABA|nr:hypothetical protein [Stylosanthes scabra]
MALTAYLDEPKRKFRSMESMWPADRDRVITHCLYHNQDERPFPGYFLSRYGHEIGWQMFTIDDSDNCLEFNLVGKGKKVSSESMNFTGYPYAQIIPSSHRKTLTTSDAYGSDLYVPADLRGELEFYGINRIWTVIGPPNLEVNVFQLMLRNSRERPGEYRFGLEWSTCCKRYKLRPGDICTFQNIIVANYQMELTIERKGNV